MNDVIAKVSDEMNFFACGVPPYVLRTNYLISPSEGRTAEGYLAKKFISSHLKKTRLLQLPRMTCVFNTEAKYETQVGSARDI